jgi:AraC-like DNA-binding protein
MTKAKMYCPETMGTFRMMFGFMQPLRYVKDYRVKSKKRKLKQ